MGRVQQGAHWHNREVWPKLAAADLQGKLVRQALVKPLDQPRMWYQIGAWE
jgi:hypothetical protein